VSIGSEISAKSLRARQVRQLAGQILAQIFLASKVQQLYAPDNENVRRSFETIAQKLDEFFESERTFRVHLEEGYLFVNEIRLRLERATSDAHYWFLERFATSGLASITIDPGVSAVELKRLVPIVARAVWAEGQPRPPLEAELSSAFVANARVTMRRARETEADDADHVEVSSARFAAHLWLRLRRAALEGCASARTGAPLSVRKARALLQLVVDAYLEDEPPLLATTRAKLFAPPGSSTDSRWDAYLAAHMTNTAILAIGLGHRLGLERRRLLDVGTAGLFADAAMATLPREIIEAPGPLSEKSRVEVDAHALRGADMLLAADAGLAANQVAAAAVARHHGSRRPGAGGPRRPLDAAVIGVADCYDAMTTDRPWRSAISHGRALREMIETCDGAEANLTRVFANMIGMFPIGSAVELSTGAVAVVVEQSREPRKSGRPVVKVLIEAGGAPGDGRRIDLAASGGGAPPTIIRTVDLGLAEGGPLDITAAL